MSRAYSQGEGNAPAEFRQVDGKLRARRKALQRQISQVVISGFPAIR